jgi:hypothetical protein
MQDIPSKRTLNKKSQVLVVEKKAFDEKLGGIASTTYEQVVGNGVAPTTSAFGVVDSKLYNERNTSESRVRWVAFDTGHTPVITKYILDDFGNPLVEEVKVVGAGTVVPINEFAKLSEKVEKLDSANDLVRTIKSVAGTFPNNKVEHRQAVEEYGGLDVNITTHREALGTPGDEHVSFPGIVGISTEFENQQRMLVKRVVVTTPDASAESVTLRDHLPNLQAEQVYKEVSVVGTNDTPTKTHLDISIQDKKVVNGQKLRTRIKVAAWVPYTDTEQDADTRGTISIVKTIEDVDTFVPSLVTGVDEFSRQLDTEKVEVTRKTLEASMIGRPFYSSKNIQYKFPGWLKPGDEYRSNQIYYYLNGATQIPVMVTAGMKEKNGQTLTVPAQLITTYHKLRPIEPEVFQFYTTTFRANTMNDGLGVIGGATYQLAIQLFGRSSIEINDMITDMAACLWTASQTGGIFKFQSIGKTAPTWLQYLVGGAYTFAQTENIPASNPTATEYVAMMTAGTVFLAGCEITPWKYNLWRQVRTYIKMPNLITPGMA